MSATPLDGVDAFQDADPIELIAPMSGNVSNDPPPTADAIPVLVLSEDPNEQVHQMSLYFGDQGDKTEGTTGELTFEILNNSNTNLFESVSLDSVTGQLNFDIRSDAFGDAILTIRATDQLGQWVDGDFEMVVNPVNDRPTTSGFDNVVVTQGQESTIVDLFAAFDDKEDADADLTFEIVSVENPALFDEVWIDEVAGHLVLEYAEDALGTSAIVLRATDTEGLSVEMTTSGADFQVYGRFGHTDSPYRPDFDQMGMPTATILTHYAFFDQLPNGRYDESAFVPDRLRDALDDIPVGFSEAIVLNIESEEHFGNTEEGRDNLAEILEVAATYRPDLEFGFYRLLPERNWHAPVRVQRALNEIAAGNLNGYHARNLHEGQNFQADYDDWLNRNELYRTDVVSIGGTVADRIDHVSPSLYMPYRARLGHADVWADPDVRAWTYYAEHNIAEARKFDVPVNAFLSPSVYAIGQRFLEKDFFRQQLDMMFELADSVTIFERIGDDPYLPENSGWLEALEEFLQYTRTPTGFQITVQPDVAPVGNPIPAIDVDRDTQTAVVNLGDLFDDPDHDDAELDFSVVSASGEVLQHHIDNTTGQLQFTLADQLDRPARVVVRATDPDGWFSENTLYASFTGLATNAGTPEHGFQVWEDSTLSVVAGVLPTMSQLIDGPAHASDFVLSSDGQLSYDPNLDWFGQDSVLYRSSGSNVSLQIAVTAVNDAPVAIAQPTTYVSFGVTSYTFGLEGLFSDIDNSFDDLRFQASGMSGEIFDSFEVSGGQGTLTFADGVTGFGDLSIQAIDPEGLVATNQMAFVLQPTMNGADSAGPTGDSIDGSRESMLAGRLDQYSSQRPVDDEDDDPTWVMLDILQRVEVPSAIGQ